MIHRRLVTAIVLLSVFTLISCTGWHLRGSGTIDLLEQAIFLRGTKSPTYAATLKQLQSRNGLSDANKAQYSLIIEQENWQSRTASLSSKGLTSEYELTLTVPYTIIQTQGQSVIADTSIRLTRSYAADSDDIGAKEKEKLLIQQDMSEAAAQAILRRLQLAINQSAINQ